MLMKGAPEKRKSFPARPFVSRSLWIRRLQEVHPPKDALDAHGRPGGLVELQNRGVDAGGVPANLKARGKPVVKAENIEAEEDEVKEKYKLLATQYGVEEDKIEDIIKVQGIEYIKKDIAMQKALDFLYENAKFIDAVKKEENNTCSCGCEHDHDHDHSH